MKKGIRGIINYKDISPNIEAIYCDELPYFYIQQCYVKGDVQSKIFAEDRFWKEYERQVANYHIIN